MSRETRSFFRRVLGDESGAAAVLVAVGIFALVGFGALSVDVGYLYSAQRELQASANAAAMAGARDIGVGGTPVATATSYSSVAGNKNANPNLTLASITPTLFCFNTGGACTINQTPTNAPNGANGIQVQEQATVPLFFGRIFGISTVQISATAVALAAGGVPHPLNVVFIVDTTGSMNGNDPVCGATRIVCALNGVKTLLGELWRYRPPTASNTAERQQRQLEAVRPPSGSGARERAQRDDTTVRMWRLRCRMPRTGRIRVGLKTPARARGGPARAE